MKKILKKIYRREIIIIFSSIAVAAFILYIIFFSKKDYSIEISNCSNMANLEVRDDCFYEIAKKTHNVELCSKISTDSFWTFFTIGNCFKETAKNMKDCFKISDENYRLFCQAIKSRDMNLCLKIKDNDLNNFCFGDLMPKSM